MAPKNERFEVRFETNTLERIDRWAERQPDRPTRSDAVRRLVEKGLEVQFDEPASLMFMMLRDISKAVKAKSEIDLDFVAEVIHGGHNWALKYQYPGLYHDHVDSPANVWAVQDVLDMWDFIEEGFEKLSTSDKTRLAKDAEPFGDHVEFPGFDANSESERFGIAKFFVEKMGRFQRFKGRELNSRCPMTDDYGRMLDVFKPIVRTIAGRALNYGEIVALMRARR